MYRKLPPQFVRLTCAVFATALTAVSASATAETYPSKSILIKVAYPAGGGADVAVRQLSAPLQQALGQPVVVENLPGAGGSLATMAYLKGPSDGYTLLGLTGNDAILNPMALASAKYRPEDLRLVHPLIISDFILVTTMEKPPKGIDELLTMAKMRPGVKNRRLGTGGSAPRRISQPRTSGYKRASRLSTFLIAASRRSSRIS
ncbi:Bug family tripartite tricarboxylate transporter substrate binding protein [Cupriavidus basilensis]